MKKIIALVTLVAVTLTSHSQSLAYDDLGILFSKDNNYGTARYSAMSGAFGALGGDHTAASINPAGGAVAIKSDFSVTLGVDNVSSDIEYYKNSSKSQGSFFNLSQAGGNFVFRTNNNSNWNRFAFTFNYRIKKDFSNNFSTKGNSRYLFQKHHLSDEKNPKTLFDRSLEQKYTNTTTGRSSIYNIGFSSVYQNRLFAGASLNFHAIEFGEVADLTEINDDEDGNILDSKNILTSSFQGGGFSLGLGFIYKFNHNLRLGLTYETPTWYSEIIEEYKDELDMRAISELNLRGVNDIRQGNPYSYGFKSSGRVTASGAYVFGKVGLISVDYTYKDYRNTKYNGTNEAFVKANQSFIDNFRATHSLKVGTEWRFDKMSIRAGASYEKDPNLVLGGHTNKDNVKSFSAGLGYNFGNMKIDLSYTNRENTKFYTLYNVGDISSANNTSRITGTVTFNL